MKTRVRTSSELTSLNASRKKTEKEHMGNGSLLEPQNCLQWHIFSRKAMPPYHSPIPTNRGASIQMPETHRRHVNQTNRPSSPTLQISGYPLPPPLPIRCSWVVLTLRSLPGTYLQGPKHMSSSLTLGISHGTHLNSAPRWHAGPIWIPGLTLTLSCIQIVKPRTNLNLAFLISKMGMISLKGVSKKSVKRKAQHRRTLSDQ